MFRQQTLEPGGGGSRELIQGLELFVEIPSSKQHADVSREVICEQHAGIAGYPLVRRVKHFVAAFFDGNIACGCACARISALDLEKMRLGTQRSFPRFVEQLRIVQHADPGIVIPELERMPEQDIKEGIGPFIVQEPILHTDGIEREARPLVQPFDVVAIIGGNDPQWINLR